MSIFLILQNKFVPSISRTNDFHRSKIVKDVPAVEAREVKTDCVLSATVRREENVRSCHARKLKANKRGILVL